MPHSGQRALQLAAMCPSVGTWSQRKHLPVKTRALRASDIGARAPMAMAGAARPARRSGERERFLGGARSALR